MKMPTRTDIRAGLKQLAGLSPTVQAMLPRLGDENLDAHELGRMVGQDPILAARVLHLANSPFYGLPRQVGSLDEAVMILGVSHLRGMVLSAGLIGLFADTHAIARSLATAAASGALAKTLKRDQGMAFTAGLLHNLGALLLGHFASEAWQSLAQASPSAFEDKLSCEKSVFGFTHCELGADIAGDWRFPETIQSAIRSHPQPPDDPAEPLTDLVHVAWAVSGMTLTGEEAIINPDVLLRLGLAGPEGESRLAESCQAARDSQSAPTTL